MNIETGNLFETIPSAVNREVFTDLIKGDNVSIERIVSRGQSSPDSGWYEQNRNEWVVVLRGEAKIRFVNGDTLHLKVGDYLNLPAGTKHKVSWTIPDTETIWLAVHYD